MSQREPFPWEKKAAELQARNDELKKKEAEYHQKGNALDRPPPTAQTPTTTTTTLITLLKALLFFPAELTVPSDSPFKNLFTDAHRLWLLSRAFLLINLLTTLLAFFTNAPGTALSSLFQTITALAYFLLYPFAAFLVCFYWIHRAALHHSRALLGIVLLGLLLQLVALACMALGLLTGACGGIFSTLNLLATRSWSLLAGACLSQFILFLACIYAVKLGKQAILLFRAPSINSPV